MKCSSLPQLTAFCVCVFGGLFWFWVGFVFFFFLEFEEAWITHPHAPLSTPSYLNASITNTKSRKTSNVYIPEMIPGYLKMNLEHVYDLKLFQT